jgi:hypothetical protein
VCHRGEPGRRGGYFLSGRSGATVQGMVNLGTVPGDPDKVTVWLGASGETDLTRREAEELAALLLRAVQELGG